MKAKFSLAVVALSLTLLGGCAGETAPATAPVATNASASQAASNAATTAATTQAAAPAGNDTDAFVGALSAAMAGVKTYRFDMTMETEVMGTPSKIVTKGVFDNSDPSNRKMLTDADFMGMAMKMLQVDGELYLQMEAMGEKWMKVPEAQRAQYAQATDTGDFSASFEKSKAAIKKVELKGEETVDGTATKHYVLSYDPSALPALTGGSGTFVGDMEYNLWVDGDSLIRKIALEGKVSDGEDALPMKLTGTMGDYNKPVTIKAPNKDDITDLPS